jgi:predicted thioesterase
MCEACGFAADDAKAGAAIACGGQLLDPAFVESAARRPTVLDEHLGKITTAAQRVVQRVLEQILVNHLAYRKRMSLTPGLSASTTLLVGQADTAIEVGSGDVPVLATPRVIALAEHAAVEAIAGALAPGTTSVGYEVQLAHLAPTPVGAKITAEATLENVDGKRLTFRVAVTDARGLVAAGRVTRVIVVRDRFIERAQAEG